MKKMFIIALACYGLSARAQMGESRNFLYLYSDSIVYAGDIKIRPDFSGNLRVRVDSRTVSMGQIKFLNSRDGFFANTRKMGVIRTSDFAERIIEGRINVFKETSLSYHPFIYNTAHADNVHYDVPATASSINVNMYYNKGFADLKRLNYSNLKRDMADNPRSIDMLKTYRRSMQTTTLLYIAGAASILAGGMTSMQGGKNAYSTSSLALGVSLGALGAGSIVGGYFNTFSANRKLEAAVDIYNQ